MSLQSTWDHVRDNWKTTVSGVLTAVIGLSAATVTPNPWISSAVSAKILGAGVIAKVLLGILQNDGKQVKVSLPDNTPVQVNLPAGSQVQQTTTIQTGENHG
jgi:hypothetical protein